MRKSFLWIAVLAMSLVASQPCQAKRVRTVRLSTYNIQHGAGMDEQIDYVRQAEIIRKAKAEVAAIQEVDSMTRRNGGRYALDEMRRKAKLPYATFAPAIDFQGGKYGVGLLSRKRPLSVKRIPLPGREEPRMLLVAEFRNYVVACTHLSLTAEDRMNSVPIIVAEASNWQKPFFVMGDLNAEPDSPFVREMQNHFLFLNPPHEKTFPSREPRICIDYVALFRSATATVSSCHTWVGEEQASDHCPLHARVSLRYE